MIRTVAALIAASVPSVVTAADPLTFTGAEHVFGPPPNGDPGYYTTIPGGTPVDGGDSFVAVVVPGTSGGYVSVGNLLGAVPSEHDVRRRIAEGDALAAAVTVVTPDPGDRFAFNLSSATTGGEIAGSGSAAYRVTDRAVAFAAASRSAHRTLAKGGLSLSVR